MPNASPSTADAGTGTFKYPTFLDPNKTGTDSASKAYPRMWTLPMAVAHLLYRYNPSPSGTVSNPTRSTLDTLLVSREPITGTPFDPTNPASYTARDIQVPDAPITGRSWPAVVHDLVKDCGFGMRVDLSADVHGIPQQALTLFLKQASTPKPLYLPTRGTALDPARCNVASADMGRDLAPVVNQWTVQGALLRYEFTCLLAPGFPSASTDASGDSAIEAFSLNQADPTAAVSDKYRVWVLAEGGDTYYLNGSTTAIPNLATDMSGVLGSPVAGVAQYVKRRRVPIGQLLTTDDNGVPLKATLQIGTTTGSAPPYPAVDLGSSITNWQDIEGGWTLLKDRIGIRITIENPERWFIGESVSGAYPDGVVRAVSAIAAASSDNPAFFLRLTCVVEGDQALKYTATRQITSPIGYPIEREIDARDRLFKNTVAANSRFASTAAVVRDDTELAKAEAIAYRTASDSGVFQGDVEIPRFTAYYQIGDRINGLTGRNLSFRTDDGGTDFSPTYPMVVARRWDFDGGQRTTLQLSDAGLDRRQYSRNKPNARPTISSEEKARQIAVLAAQIQKAGFGVALNSNLSKHGR